MYTCIVLKIDLKCFHRAQLTYLNYASQSAQPSMDQQMQLLKPTSDKIQAIQNLREKSRASAFFNHLSAISESIPALGWVTVVSNAIFKNNHPIFLYIARFNCLESCSSSLHQRNERRRTILHEQSAQGMEREVSNLKIYLYTLRLDRKCVVSSQG